MKPILSALITYRNEKPIWIPLPLPQDCDSIFMLSDRVGYFGRFDSEYEKIIAYRSSFGITPDVHAHWEDVDYTAKCLVNFTQKQFDCIKTMCEIFDLTFKDIDGFITFLCNSKGVTIEEISNKGV